MSGPNASVALEAISVLEIDSGKAQYGGKLLADLGATVIKVEPIAGAPARSVGPFLDDRPDPNGSLDFWHYNTSKKSMTLDLGQAAGAAIFATMAAGADVVIHDLPAAAAGEARSRYDELSAANPGLVYCAVSDFGVEGPWSGYVGSDLVHLALGGHMAVTGYDEEEDPRPVGPTGRQAANLTGVVAAIGVLAALNHRSDSGRGQFIDVATHDVLALSTEMAIPFWEFHKKNGLRQTGRHGRPYVTPPWNHRCRDGKYFSAMPLYLDDRRFADLVSWMDDWGMAEDLGDDRYADDQVRNEELFHVVAVLERFCARHDSSYLFDEAQKRRLPWAPINAPEDLLEYAHLTEDRGAFEPVAHPELEREYSYAGPPYQLGATPARVSRRAPLLGEDSEELLGELGFSSAQIVELREGGVI